FCVLAVTACGRGNLAPSPGPAALSAPGARPATLHVVPLHTYTIAETFIGKSGGSAGLIGDPKTGLFGIAPAGGDLKCRDGNRGCGFVYELTQQAGTSVYKETRIYTFHGAAGHDGAEPGATLIIGARGTGVLYGTTVLGGAHGKGIIFRLTPTTTPYKYVERVIYSFGAGKTDGQYPYASLIEIHRILYGTTSESGAYGKGTAFSINVTGASEKTLHAFGGPKDGATPYASLIDYKGTLYGTTSTGGSSQNCGTVFSMSTSGTETVLHRFQNSPYDGCDPLGSGVVELNGALYGTTSAGGEHNYCHCGTIYSMSTSGAERVLHSFAGGGSPVASLIAYSNVLYGTTFYGGLPSGSKCSLDPTQGCGVVFSLNPSGTPPYQVQFPFTGTRDGGGAGPAAPLLASGGDFFGTTSRGSTLGHGEAFELTP
ncbi:MAG TPA: choice-of-anchor tandem repeat GloVer-containing protein, partial [Candidatus Cybelea sp.]